MVIKAGAPTVAPGLEPLVGHFTQLFQKSSPGVTPRRYSIAEISSFGWMPPRDLFPTTTGGANRLLTRVECHSILDAVVRNTYGHIHDSAVSGADTQRSLARYTDHATRLMLVNTGLTMHMLQRDMPDHQVVAVMRDGLTIAMPDFYLEDKAIDGAIGIHWPGVTATPAVTDAQKDVWDFRTRMWRESAYHLGGIAAAAAHDLNLLHEDSIAGAFLEGISGKPEDFDRFVRHIKWQLRQSGTPVSDRVVVYDSWGSGKSALLVVSALCTLYPDIEVKFLLGSVYNEGQLPSVQGEYESRYHARLDGSWPFAEMLNPDTGEVEILMGKDAGPRPDVALTESAAQVLAAYNMAMRIEEGHDIEDMEDLLLRPDMTDEAAVDFLFPS